MVDSTLERSNVHPDWLKLFPELFAKAFSTLEKLDSYLPAENNALRVFKIPPKSVRVVIVGQDPYPDIEVASGLAFSSHRSNRLPKSIQNIFKELQSDLGVTRTDGDLRDWEEQGVFLINRLLTTSNGNSNGHKNLGWEEFTEEIIAFLGKQGAVGFLMGKSAGEMQCHFQKVVVTAHPSPLSAYRGFFGSKPFSRVNALLAAPIKW